DDRPEAGKTGSRGKSPADTIIGSGERLGAAGDAAAPKAGKTGSHGKSPADTIIESGELLGAAGDTAALKKEVVEKKVEENKVKAISVDVARLDDLLEIVGEVSLLGSYITTKLAGQDGLSLQTNNLARSCARLQELANSLRMTSIRPLFMAVRRAAAEAARASRKMIEINMRGIDTQVDRSIVENLSAALIHITRNAVDHGIEPADVRRRAGKQERGAITISASRTNSDISIELGDDGGGFDIKTIRDKAVSMGKILPDAKLSEGELADLVFLPGLSTAKKLTGLSGRGVGMEIVRESIDNLRGKVEIHTAEGKGTTVRMRFPLMVAAMDGMLMRVGKNILVIPVAQVRECFRPKPSDIGLIETRGTIVTIRNVILPVLFLGREFGIESDATTPEDGVLVVVETGETLAAVLVDETLGSSQVVIRALDGPLANSGLVAGAAVLPDGRIGLVIETASLTARVAISAAKAFNDAGKRQAESSRQVDTVYIGSNQVGMINFNIVAPDGHGGGRTHVFAINAFKTREFVPVAPLRAIPNSPPGFVGMMMLRNRTVPIVHMGVILGLMSEGQRRSEWEQIALICEFSGQTVGFLVSAVERVSYISWSDIMPPPSTGGLIQFDYVVGIILMSKLNDVQSKKPTGDGKGGKAGKAGESRPADKAQVAFVLDFERIVGNAIQLYGDMGAELGKMTEVKKKTVNILLVEDSPLIRKRTKKALSSSGINVIEAGDGQEAWERIEAMRKEADAAKKSIFSMIDLVLSDIEMPRMDGYTLTYNIKHDATLRVLPVLLHSSITNDNMISRATEVEADGFIPKCDPRELADKLKKYL
ncbi:MAG: chemotaxis protein CheW, partial [Planctomycetota bacterium]|nr:chemotaxis protein CheW [Planctomycetota bacterium]